VKDPTLDDLDIWKRWKGRQRVKNVEKEVEASIKRSSIREKDGKVPGTQSLFLKPPSGKRGGDP